MNKIKATVKAACVFCGRSKAEHTADGSVYESAVARTHDYRAPVQACKRCHRTASEAGTPILGDVCGDCADDLRDEVYS